MQLPLRMLHFGCCYCYCFANLLVSVVRQISFAFVFDADYKTTHAPHSSLDPIFRQWRQSFRQMVAVGRQNMLQANAFLALRWKSFFLKKGFDIDYNKLLISIKKRIFDKLIEWNTINKRQTQTQIHEQKKNKRRKLINRSDWCKIYTRYSTQNERKIKL